MNSELMNKKKIFEAIDLAKYGRTTCENYETIFNDNCSDEIKFNMELTSNGLVINFLESNSCSIAEFGTSVVIKNIENKDIFVVKKEIQLYKEAIDGASNKYSDEYPFLKNLILRKSCLLMFANYVERKIDDEIKKTNR